MVTRPLKRLVENFLKCLKTLGLTLNILGFRQAILLSINTSAFNLSLATTAYTLGYTYTATRSGTTRCDPALVVNTLQLANYTQTNL